MDQVLVSGVNFLIGVLIARYLGIKILGQFTLIWLVIQFVNTIQYAMIINPMMIIGAKQFKQKAKLYFGGTLKLELLFVVISFFLLSIFLLVGKGFGQQRIFPITGYVFLFAGCFFWLHNFLRRYFFTVGEVYRAFILDVIGYGGQFFLIFYVLLLKNVTELVIIFYVTGGAFLFSFIIGGIWMLANISFLGSMKFIINRHRKFVSGIFVFTIIQWIGPQIILGLSGVLLGAVKLGGIRSMINLLAPINVLVLGLQNYLPMKGSKIFHQDGKKKLYKLLFKVSGYTIIIFSIVSALVFAYRIQLIEIVYTEEYLEYSYLLLWQVGYLFVNIILVFTTIYIKTIENTESLVLGSILTLPISLALVYFLLPIYEEKAAFFGLIVNQGIILLSLVAQLRRSEI